MGAFCVFGISKTACKLAAEKKQPTFDDQTKRPFTKEEWAVKRDELAAKLFESTERRVKVSPEFDAPQFCESWLAVDPTHIKWPVIMARGAKIDKKGNPVLRNGVPVETWLEYTPERIAA